MNGLSVPVAVSLSPSLGEGMTRGCGGMTATAGAVCNSGYSLTKDISSPERRALSHGSRGVTRRPKRPGATFTNYFQR